MTVLRLLSKGEEVKTLQRILNLIPDGVFGPITEEAVKAFQNDNGLFPDGIVGPKTWAMLMPSDGVVLKRSRRRIELILVHCTATPAGKDYTVDQIKDWHTAPKPKGNGWSDIGYHYIIYRDGSVHLGRDVDLVGAHCEGFNAHSIGIVYVGGMSADGKKNEDTRTDAQKLALLDLLVKLKQLYPNAEISGHRNYDKKGKTCPNFDARNEYRDL
jgi:N-acetylmuramoyl-L-alanine amidase